MSTDQIVSASADVAADAAAVFELIADPSRQPEWDGNDNLSASTSPRVRQVGDVFEMTTTSDRVRENHVVEFEEGLLIAWRPSAVGEPQPGHLWRWELEPTGPGACRVTHTYDWTQLDDPSRLERARSTTPAKLQASIDHLKTLAEAWPRGPTAPGGGDLATHQHPERSLTHRHSAR